MSGDHQFRAADDAILRNRPHYDHARPGRQAMASDLGSQPEAVDTAMAAHPVLANEAAVGRHLLDGELDEPCSA
jgi:hypothetical protein